MIVTVQMMQVIVAKPAPGKALQCSACSRRPHRSKLARDRHGNVIHEATLPGGRTCGGLIVEVDE